VFWLDGAGAIGGLSQPAQALDPDGGAQIFFTNTGNYVIVANGQVVTQFSMPGCAPMDAPPATPAPSTGTGGPSVSSSLATGGAVLAFVAVLLGGAILFLVPRRISQDG